MNTSTQDDDTLRPGSFLLPQMTEFEIPLPPALSLAEATQNLHLHSTPPTDTSITSYPSKPVATSTPSPLNPKVPLLPPKHSATPKFAVPPPPPNKPNKTFSQSSLSDDNDGRQQSAHKSNRFSMPPLSREDEVNNPLRAASATPPPLKPKIPIFPPKNPATPNFSVPLLPPNKPNKNFRQSSFSDDDGRQQPAPKSNRFSMPPMSLEVNPPPAAATPPPLKPKVPLKPRVPLSPPKTTSKFAVCSSNPNHIFRQSSLSDNDGRQQQPYNSAPKSNRFSMPPMSSFEVNPPPLPPRKRAYSQNTSTIIEEAPPTPPPRTKSMGNTQQLASDAGQMTLTPSTSNEMDDDEESGIPLMRIQPLPKLTSTDDDFSKKLSLMLPSLSDDNDDEDSTDSFNVPKPLVIKSPSKATLFNSLSLSSSFPHQPMKTNNCDFESRFSFSKDIPPPEKWASCPKLYPSNRDRTLTPGVPLAAAGSNNAVKKKAPLLPPHMLS